MSKKKQGGKLVQQKRPRPKFLGIKVADGRKVLAGEILVRQKGTQIKAGNGVRVGRDYTLYSIKSGIAKYGTKYGKKVVSIL